MQANAYMYNKIPYNYVLKKEILYVVIHIGAENGPGGARGYTTAISHLYKEHILQILSNGQVHFIKTTLHCQVIIEILQASSINNSTFNFSGPNYQINVSAQHLTWESGIKGIGMIEDRSRIQSIKCAACIAESSIS